MCHLHQLHLELVEPGIWALIGPNGSGKTTLLDCIANLQTFDSGEISINGKKHDNPNVYQTFAYLQDNRVLYPELTGLEHLRLVQTIQGLPKERIEEVIEEIGIRDYVNIPVKNYSLGMKQHLLLAIGIMNKPQVMLLDEPLNGLDPTSYIQTRKLLQKLAKNGSTIIVSSHQLNEVDQLTDQLLFLKQGKIIEWKLEQVGRQYAVQTSDNQTVYQKLGQVKGLTLVNDSIQVNTSIHSLHFYLDQLMTCQVEILDISIQEHQSEEIYKELFE
ncbi:ABC transporter ATP-binding protein [Streptococcus suis]|uniref:ABC transporter ATP-binding protein n=1 Tax=Streptococcus suis TaxID=1307 RepID=UPI003757D735